MVRFTAILTLLFSAASFAQVGPASNSIVPTSAGKPPPVGPEAALIKPASTTPIDRNAERGNRVNAAVENAVAQLYDDLSKQSVFGKVTVRDLLIRTATRDQFLTTLRTADQIGGPRWIDDNTVQVRLSINGRDAAASLIEIANTYKDRSPVTADELAPLADRWGRRTFSAIGMSSAPLADAPPPIVAQGQTPATRPARAVLPNRAPQWASRTIQADGASGDAGGKLRAARVAELKALINLRTQVNALPLAAGTVGDAAQTDPQLSAAIDRAVQRARLTKVDYLASGGANVRTSLDLADLWREIDASRAVNSPSFRR